MAPENPRTHALCVLSGAEMSRPRKNIRRDRQLNFSLTQAELERIRLRAMAAGMRLMDFGRALLLRERPAPAAPDHAVSAVERLSAAEMLLT